MATNCNATLKKVNKKDFHFNGENKKERRTFFWDED